MSGRRILLALDPGVLEGALARMLSTGFGDDLVQRGGPRRAIAAGVFDVAVVCEELPDGVEAAVVITLPDTRGSGGMGTVQRGEVVQEVSIADAERVVELIEQYAPRPWASQNGAR
jgi:hypothetical protein